MRSRHVFEGMRGGPGHVGHVHVGGVRGATGFSVVRRVVDAVPGLANVVQLDPRRQLFIAIAERMWRQPQEEYGRLFRFLGLNQPKHLAPKKVQQRSYEAELSPRTRRTLQSVFRPYNERLRVLLEDAIREWPK